MDFIFIKGKNEELSNFEIISYLESRNYKYDILDESKEFLIARLDEIYIEKMMKSLGGTLKIADVLLYTAKDEIENNLGKMELEKIFKERRERLIFGVSVYSEKDSYKIYKSVGNYFKKTLKQYGIRAKYFGFDRKRKPQLTNVEVIKKNLISESAEIIVCCSKNKAYVGITKAIHNPFEFQKRDVGRPKQRIIFSISPRLSNILINLSWAKEGDTILDPFCGIGTILQEAVLNGIKIRGLDLDSECIEAAKENLKWLAKEYELYFDEKIMVGDSRKLSEYFEENSIDAIATEPYLGPPLKKKPSLQEINEIFEEIKNLYEDSLREMYKVLKPNKRIAIVSPCIRTTKSKCIKFDFKSIASKIGFKTIKSFIDAEERHKTVREIFVIQKP
jgi:tRNA G10  N-methylase Trm11